MPSINPSTPLDQPELPAPGSRVHPGRLDLQGLPEPVAKGRFPVSPQHAVREVPVPALRPVAAQVWLEGGGVARRPYANTFALFGGKPLGGVGGGAASHADRFLRCHGQSKDRPSFLAHASSLDRLLPLGSCPRSILQRVEGDTPVASAMSRRLHPWLFLIPAIFIRFDVDTQTNICQSVPAMKRTLTEKKRSLRREARRIAWIYKNSDWPMTAKTMSNGIVKRAIELGIITKGLSCESCSSDRKLYAHHDDYAKPLKVRWLCPKCHAQCHKRQYVRKV